MKERRVLVLNQFALPLSQGGGTRHVELFGKLRHWDAAVVGGSRHYFDQRPVSSEGIFKTVWVSKYRGNGIGRVINWLSYCFGAVVAGVRHRGTSVVYGSSPHLGAAAAGLFVARLKRCPFVLEVRDMWPQILAEAGTLDERGRVYRALKVLERYLYRHATRIVVLAEGNIAAIVREGAGEDKIIFIPNGADPADFEVAENRVALRKRFRFDTFTVVYAGAHGPANGLEFVLEAAERLKECGDGVAIVLFGDGVSKADLAAEAARRGLTTIRFRDPIPKSEIPALLAAADAGLHCLADVELFKTGVSPNKLYDYMAASLPVITNTGGDVAKMVASARSGVAVGPDAIADGVRLLLNADDETLASYGTAGREYMARERSRKAMAGRLEDMLDELV